MSAVREQAALTEDPLVCGEDPGRSGARRPLSCETIYESPVRVRDGLPTLKEVLGPLISAAKHVFMKPYTIK